MYIFVKALKLAARGCLECAIHHWGVPVLLVFPVYSSDPFFLVLFWTSQSVIFEQPVFFDSRCMLDVICSDNLCCSFVDWCIELQVGVVCCKSWTFLKCNLFDSLLTLNLGLPLFFRGAWLLCVVLLLCLVVLFSSSLGVSWIIRFLFGLLHSRVSGWIWVVRIFFLFVLLIVFSFFVEFRTVVHRFRHTCVDIG